jgi:LacI family transcriptional regulator
MESYRGDEPCLRSIKRPSLRQKKTVSAPSPAPSNDGRRAAPTIKDVAQRAGVSLGTASNVLNGKANVSEARRELVLRAASDIGYRPNRLARGLRQQRTHVIGLCVPTISSVFHASLVEEINEIAFRAGRQLMQVLSGGDPTREAEHIGSLVSLQVDGIILMPSPEAAATLELLRQTGTPAVIIDRMLDERHLDLVLLDHGRAMREVIEHLMALGHRRLLFIVRHPHLATTNQRIRVLQEMAAASRGRLEAELLVTTLEPEVLPRELPLRLRGSKAPSAIIASNSINTLWTLRALRGTEFSIPEDISLVAFDEPAWGELIQPALTVVKQPTRHIAELAWSMLMRRIDDPRLERKLEVLRNELIVRASSGPAKYV